MPFARASVHTAKDKECSRRSVSPPAPLAMKRSERARKLSNWSGSTLGENDLDLVRQIEIRGGEWEERGGGGQIGTLYVCMRYRARAEPREKYCGTQQGVEGESRAAYTYSRILTLSTVWFLLQISGLAIVVYLPNGRSRNNECKSQCTNSNR